MIFFKVTHLDLFPPTHPPPDPQDEPDLETLELLSQAHFGALLDPTSTKLIQTGLEQCLVPDVARALGIREFFRLQRWGRTPCYKIFMLSFLPLIAGLPPLDPEVPKDPADQLYRILCASSQPGASAYGLPHTVLLSGPRGVGKQTLVSRVAAAAGFHLADVSCFSLLGETEVRTAAAVESWVERARSASPAVLLLRQLEGLARRAQSIEAGGREPSVVRVLSTALAGLPGVVVVGTTSEAEHLSPGLASVFKLNLTLSAPTEAQRIAILAQLTERDRLAPDVNLQTLGRGTASLVAKDLVALVSHARAAGTRRALGPSGTRRSLQSVGAAGIQLTGTDFSSALAAARRGYADSIGAPKIPEVRWEDVGGLESVKEAILETLTLPLSRPDLFASGLRRRSGILLFGPPGTGKTMVAKAVATSVGMNFMSVKGPELLDQYIGESEAKVRRVFERARAGRPTVVFFDELDALAPRRGNQGDSGGVMDRIVSQLLAELDSMSSGGGEGGSESGEVFVMGATNRPDLLEPALLRPGRFEKLVYLGGIETEERRVEVVKALTRKMRLGSSVDLREVVRGLGEGVVTGADLYSVCADGMMRAMSRLASEAEAEAQKLGISVQMVLESKPTRTVNAVVVEREDLLKAAQSWVGSVSEAEMEHYRAAQLRFTREGNLLGGGETGLEKKEKKKGKGKGRDTGKGKGKAI